MNNFIYENFDAIETQFYNETNINTYLIRGHLKTGGSQTIAEVNVDNFDLESEAVNVANHVKKLLESDLENYNKYKYLDENGPKCVECDEPLEGSSYCPYCGEPS